MSKKSTQTEWRGSALEFTQSEKTVPKSLVRHHMADVDGLLQARCKEKNQIRQDAARFWNKAQRPSSANIAKGGTPVRATDASRQLRNQLAKKLILPTPAITPPGLLSYSLRFAPPYDYAYIAHDVTGPGNNPSADRFSGQMSMAFSVESNFDALHYCQVEMGSFFFPPAYAAVVGAKANPSFAFAWWLNSLAGFAAVRATLFTAILAYKGTDIIDSAYSNELVVFDESVYGMTGAQIDWGTVASAPMFVQLKLGPSDFYLVYVSCNCTGGAGGGNALTGQPIPGTPDDLAGGLVNIALPSITLEVSTILTNRGA